MSVTILIPAWQAESFIATALSAAIAQPEADRIVVSVDQSSDRTAEVCRSFADPRVEVVEQPDRLGWVANVNALFDLVDTDMFMILFHDDEIPSGYLRRLIQATGSRPDAVAWCPSLKRRGLVDDRPSLPLLDHGDAHSRVRQQLVDQTAAPLRSLTCSRVLADGRRLRDHGFNGLGAGVEWVLALTLAGSIVTVPEAEYTKRVWDGSVTSTFRARDVGWRSAAWQAMSDGMVEVLSEAGFTAAQQGVLTQAAGLRLAERVVHAHLADKTDPDPSTEWLGHVEPADDDNKALAARLAVAQGRLLQRQGQVALAEDRFRSAAAWDPSDAAPRYLLSGMATAGGSDAEALDWACQAAEADPCDAQARATLIACLIRAGRGRDAVTAAERALAMPGLPASRAQQFDRLHAQALATDGRVS